MAAHPRPRIVTLRPVRPSGRLGSRGIGSMLPGEENAEKASPAPRPDTDVLRNFRRVILCSIREWSPLRPSVGNMAIGGMKSKEEAPKGYSLTETRIIPEARSLSSVRKIGRAHV